MEKALLLLIVSIRRYKIRAMLQRLPLSYIICKEKASYVNLIINQKNISSRHFVNVFSNFVIL